MGYGQWAAFNIMNKGKTWNVSIKNPQTYWGKFYNGPNKDIEISSDQVAQTNIAAQGKAAIWTCGRSDTSSGTEGIFDICDGNTKICTLYWSCPWSGSNTVQVCDSNDDYLVSVGNFDYNGPIGNINVKVGRIA